MGTAEEAESLRSRILSGTPFEDLARAYSMDPSAGSGGYLGSVVIDDLRQDYQEALIGLNRGETSRVVRIDDAYFLFQLLSDRESDWWARLDRARRAVNQGREDDAEESLRAALRIAEALAGPSGQRLLGESLRNLASLSELQGEEEQAQQLYRRAMSVFWSGPSTDGDSAVARVLEAFCEVLSLGAFQDAEFESALADYTAAVRRASLDENLYLVMSAIFDAAGLTQEAELTLVLGVGAYPDSVVSLRQLADRHMNSGKVRQALEEFQRGAQIASNAGMLESRRSYFYQATGEAYSRLVLYNNAAQAYRLALETDADNFDARLGLGYLHFLDNRFEEALIEYGKIPETDSGIAELPYRVAQVRLSLGQYQDAVEAAERALEVRPDDRGSLYVMGTALIRMGRMDEGRSRLTRLGELEAALERAESQTRALTTLHSGATAALMEGEYARAIELYESAIQTHPDAVLFRFNLASTQSRIGRHEEALANLERMVELGMGNYLLHRKLASEYEELGDADASQRHRTMYLQGLDASLRAELN